MLTVNVTLAEPPCELETVAVQVPGFSGVTTSAKVWPDPDGVPKETIALEPVPHDAVSTEIVETARLVVTVTVWAYALPVPENVMLEGDAFT